MANKPKKLSHNDLKIISYSLEERAKACVRAVKMEAQKNAPKLEQERLAREAKAKAAHAKFWEKNIKRFRALVQTPSLFFEEDYSRSSRRAQFDPHRTNILNYDDPDLVRLRTEYRAVMQEFDTGRRFDGHIPATTVVFVGIPTTDRYRRRSDSSPWLEIDVPETQEEAWQELASNLTQNVISGDTAAIMAVIESFKP